MSLENYLLKSNAPAQEIRYDFSAQEVEQLYNLVSSLQFAEYREFVREYLQDIQKYISLSPSQRKQKKWVGHPHNLLIRMAALQIADETVRLLNNIFEIVYVVDSGSYRKFHSIIAEGLSDVLAEISPFATFPFHDERYAQLPWKKS